MGSRFQRLRGLPSCASEEEGGGLSPARTATSSELTLLDAFRAALAHESLPSPTQIRRRSLGGRAHGLLSSAASSLHAHAQQTADEVPPQRLREAAHHSQLSDETVRSMHAEMLGALLQALPQAKAADAAAVAQEVAAASLHGTAARPLSARAARGGRSASRWTTPVLSTGSESDVQDAPAADVGDGDGATLSAGGQIEGLLSRLGSLKASREVLREQSLEEEAEAEAARLREMLLGISSVVGCPQASLIQSGPVVPSKTELLNGVGVASSVVASVSQSPSCSAHAERPRNVRPVADTLDTLELLEEHFPPHIAQLFSSESWELRVMAIDRLSLVLEDMLSGEDGVRKRGVAIVGDASSVSPLSSVPSSPDSSDAPPRFWAKAAPIHPGRLHSRRLHIGAPLEEESESEGEQELEVGEMSEMGAPETRVTGEQVRAEADNSTGAKEQGLAESGPLLVEPSPREVEMLQAVCWMLRDALADAEARVAAAALEALSPAKPLLDLLVPRCAPREARDAMELLLSPLESIMCGNSIKAANGASEALLAIADKVGIEPLVPHLTQPLGSSEPTASVARLRLLRLTLSSRPAESQEALPVEVVMPLCIDAIRTASDDVRRAAAEILVHVYTSADDVARRTIETLLAQPPMLPAALVEDVQIALVDARSSLKF